MLQAQGVESEAPFSDESEMEIAMIGEKSPIVISLRERLRSAMVSKTARRVAAKSHALRGRSLTVREAG